MSDSEPQIHTQTHLNINKELDNTKLSNGLFGYIVIMLIYSICPIVLLVHLFKSDSYPEISDNIKILAKINMISCIVLNVCLCILVYFVKPNIFNKIYKVLYFCNFIFTVVMCIFVLNLNFKDNNVFITLYSLTALCLLGFMVPLFFIL
jgi:hypothetical protein